MCTRKMYGKTYTDHNLTVARYLLITFLLQLQKIHTISLHNYPCRTWESFFTVLQQSLFSDTNFTQKFTRAICRHRLITVTVVQ